MESVPLKLLDLTLKPSGSCLSSAFGDFTTHGSSLGKAQQQARTEMVLLRPGGVVELYAIQRRAPSEDQEDDEDDDEEDERSKISVDILSRIETRSVLRSLAPVRLPGNKRDVVAIGSDSGCLSVIDLGRPTTPKLLHCPTFGNAGCRRNAPGQYVAADPKGRAVMVASVEKRKLVYVLNQDSAGEPTIASPLEAHRARTVTYDVVGADNGYDNPIFAALEVQYPEYVPPDEEEEDELEETPNDENNPHDVDAAAKESRAKNRRAWRPEDLEKQLAYYELDLGLNHVSRRWATPVHRTACTLAAVPGGADGPGGVLVGGEDYIEYRHETQSPKDPPLCLAIPRRKHHPPTESTLVTRIVVHRQKRNKFFALCQTELGDVFKITVTLDPDTKESVVGLTLHVMDTLPVASGLNISRMGVLFVSAEFGPSHNLYQFERIDLDDGVTVCTSSEDVRREWEERGGGTSKINPNEFFTTSTAVTVAPTFIPRRLLENLTRVYEMPNLSPTFDVLVGELAGGETSPQLYIPRGRGNESSLKILRHGSAVTELAVSDLPGTPGDVFVIQEIPGGEGSLSTSSMDRYIIVSFADATLVLSIGDTVEEVPPEGDSSIGFLTNAPTLACSTLSQSNGMVQIHPGGVRHVRGGLAKQWHCPGLKRIEKAGCNASQILISLAGSGEVIYFELDPMSGNLVEAGQVDLGSEVLCVDVGEIGSGRSRSPFAAVGCRDQTVRILNLLPPAVPGGKAGSSGALLSQRGSTALRARPHSVCMQQFDSAGGNADIGLSIGLDDGSVLRTAIDPITGQIASDASPTRRFLGVRPVTVLRARVQDQPCALMLSSRPWVSRYDTSTTGGGGGAGTAGAVGSSTTTTTCPLSYVPLDHACPLRSEIIREGIVATAGTTLRILTVDDTSYRHSPNEVFNSNSVPLRYTPRGMCLCNGMLAIVEADVNDFGLDEKRALGFDPTASPKEGKGGKKKKDKDGDGDDMDMDMDVDMDVDDDEQQEKKQDEEKKEEGGGASDDEEDDDDDDDDEDLVGKETPVRGPVPPTPGVWGSCVRLVNPATASTLSDSPIELDRNETALCCASVQFHSRGGESLLAVGTVTNYVPLKKTFTAAHIVLYRLVGTGGGGGGAGDDGGAGVRLQLLHKTRVEGVPLALAHFQGRLLAGVGPTLRLYEMGKRQLLRKCELRGVVPTAVRTLQTAGDRAYVGDLLHGVFFVRYDAARNAFALLGRDGTGRAVTCQELLDVHTVAVGDKFGNVTVLRLPKGAASGVGDAGSNAGGSATRALWETESNTPKLDALCQYYVGEVVTGMTRASLVSGHAEALIYVTITGRVGALVPLQSRDDVEFYQSLEMSLRSDNDVPTRFTGRDPMAYRSYYAPVKHVVDGDLCESYSKVLNLESQKKIADTLDRTVGEVRKKLEDTRNGLL